jgi:hypothetical protein
MVMQANSVEHQPYNESEMSLGIASGLMAIETDDEAATHNGEPTYFRGHYANCMDMYADAAMVAQYLNAHQGWFYRCAQPMKVDPLGDNGYALIIGRFGSFGYEIEPKVGLHLLPAQAGVYRIETIDIPGYVPVGYDVDFQASLQLVEVPGDTTPVQTKVEWQLDLKVAVHFPKFIHALPKPLIQGTGDRLLNQIVRQVSRYLTHKVQVDFHATHNIPFTKKSRWHYPWQRTNDMTLFSNHSLDLED